MGRIEMSAKIGIAAVWALLVSAPLQTVSAQALFAGPKPGLGQVIFFRPKSVSFSEKCQVRERGVMLGRVGNGHYFILNVTPGTHQYATKVITDNAISLSVESGKTYFVKCKIGEGVSIGRPLLYTSDRVSFEEKLPSMSLENPKKMARDIAVDAAKRASYGGN
jgi:Protein of unknown function (DUF2846)